MTGDDTPHEQLNASINQSIQLDASMIMANKKTHLGFVVGIPSSCGCLASEMHTDNAELWVDNGRRVLVHVRGNGRRKSSLCAAVN